MYGTLLAIGFEHFEQQVPGGVAEKIWPECVLPYPIQSMQVRDEIGLTGKVAFHGGFRIPTGRRLGTKGLHQ